jgi:hypothetical protein
LPGSEADYLSGFYKLGGRSRKGLILLSGGGERDQILTGVSHPDHRPERTDAAVGPKRKHDTREGSHLRTLTRCRSADHVLSVRGGPGLRLQARDGRRDSPMMFVEYGMPGLKVQTR